MKTREQMTPITSMDNAFLMLVEAGATVAEAWDYAPRIGSDWRTMLKYSARDARLDLAMWRREDKR